MRRPLLACALAASGCFHESDPRVVPETTGSSTGAPTATSSEPASTSLAESSSSASPADTTAADSTGAASCGDEVVDAGEDCDDGNDVPGDGCSACRTSGSVEWSTTVGAPAQRDHCYGVVLGAGVFAVGSLGTAAEQTRAWVERFERDGTPSWRFDHDDDQSSTFRAVTFVDDGQLVAAGIRDNAYLLVGVAWAKRFTAGGVSGPDEELVWPAASGSAGFVDVATMGSELVLSASVGTDSGYEIWYGQQPLAAFPSDVFATESWSGGTAMLAEALDRGGMAAEPRLRATRRSIDGAALDPITLVAFDGAVVDPPSQELSLAPRDTPVVVAVDGSGRTWVCRTADDPAAEHRDLELMRLSESLVTESTRTIALGADAVCHAIVAVGDGVVVGGTLAGGSPFVAELDPAMELAWSSTLDGQPAVVRSLALDDAGDAVAVCGSRVDGEGLDTTDAWVALVVR